MRLNTSDGDALFAHRTLVCEAAPGLDYDVAIAATNMGLGSEAVDIRVDCSTETCGHFVNWLYTGNLGAFKQDPDAANRAYADLVNVLNLRSFATYYDCVDAFHDTIVDALIKTLVGPYDVDFVDFWELFDSDDHQDWVEGRQLAIDFIVHAAPSKLSWGYFDIAKLLQDYLTEDEILEVASGFLNSRAQGVGARPVPPYVANPCRYHKHVVQGLPCCSKSKSSS